MKSGICSLKMINRLVPAILLLVFILVCLILESCLTIENINYKPGIYEGAATGYRGQVRVRVIISENGIEDIEMEDHREDSYASQAMEEIRELIIETGYTDSIETDAVAGATISCTALFNAVENALERAAQ